MESSQADLIRDHITKQIANGVDYKNRSAKRADVQEFIKNHPELKGSEKNISDHFGKILKSIAKENKIPTEQVGIKPRTPKVNQSMISQMSDMDATIEPRPQAVLVGAPQVAQPQISGQPVQEGQKMPVQYDEKGVSATIDAFYLILRSGFAPESDLLSDEEKTSLGRMWTPIFQRYFTEDYQVIGVAVIGTAGILIPKLAKGRKIKKEKESKEKEEKQPES